MLVKIGIIILSCIFITVIHEAGHYLMSRKFGLQPNLFRVGVGPVIFRKGILEITAFPFSGMVNNPDDEWAALSQPKQKMIAFTGSMVNLIVGLATVYWMPFFGLLNLTIGFGNLVPIKTRRIKSDGAYVFGNIPLMARGAVGCMLGIVALAAYAGCLLLVI